MIDDRMEIARLERELQLKKERLKEIEENCNHVWHAPVYDPEPYKEPVFSHYEPHGSDPELIYNYVDSKRDRWSRTCKRCGKQEFTCDIKAVKYEPDFGQGR